MGILCVTPSVKGKDPGPDISPNSPFLDLVYDVSRVSYSNEQTNTEGGLFSN